MRTPRYPDGALYRPPGGRLAPPAGAGLAPPVVDLACEQPAWLSFWRVVRRELRIRSYPSRSSPASTSAFCHRLRHNAGSRMMPNGIAGAKVE